MPKKIEPFCNRIIDLLHKSEKLGGIAFIDSLAEIDKCCAEILIDEERALQSKQFKALAIYKCRLFDIKKAEFKNSSKFTNDKFLEIYKKFCDYEKMDNRILLRIEDEIAYERKCHLECGFSEDSFHPFYRIKDYKSGKYTLFINDCNYNDLSIEQLCKELEEEKEELKELEEEFEDFIDLDEDDYDEYDFESEEEYKERIEEIDDDIYFCKCNIELIEKILKNHADSK